MIDELIRKIDEKENPTVVGLDPRLSMVPPAMLEEAYARYGKNLKGASRALFGYNKAIIDAVYDLVPAVKPQIALYECYGLDGLAAFKDTVDYAHEKGLIVIGDVKRGDIASTAQAYAQAHLGFAEVEGQRFTPFGEDFATVNPYMGVDAIQPFLDVMKENNKGIFVLVRTSNPGSGELQDLTIKETGLTVYETVGRLTSEWGSGFMGEYGYSDVGAVVGATHPAQAEKLRDLFPSLFFLVPGYGAQEATAEDLSVCFDKNGRGAIVNSSRGILAAWKNKRYEGLFKQEDFAEAARRAVEDMKEDLNRVRG